MFEVVKVKKGLRVVSVRGTRCFDFQASIKTQPRFLPGLLPPFFFFLFFSPSFYFILFSHVLPLNLLLSLLVRPFESPFLK